MGNQRRAHRRAGAEYPVAPVAAPVVVSQSADHYIAPVAALVVASQSADHYIAPVAGVDDSLDSLLQVSEILELESLEESDTLQTALPSGGIDLKDHLSAIEIGLIRRALKEADGTVAEAARLLRIRRTTLVEKLRKYRLSA